LYEEVGEGTSRRLNYHRLCFDCVRNKARKIQLGKKSQEDDRLLKEILKQPVQE